MTQNPQYLLLAPAPLFLLLFLLQDFCYYWFHRTSHLVRWFWASPDVPQVAGDAG